MQKVYLGNHVQLTQKSKCWNKELRAAKVECCSPRWWGGKFLRKSWTSEVSGDGRWQYTWKINFR